MIVKFADYFFPITGTKELELTLSHNSSVLNLVLIIGQMYPGFVDILNGIILNSSDCHAVLLVNGKAVSLGTILSNLDSMELIYSM